MIEGAAASIALAPCGGVAPLFVVFIVVALAGVVLAAGQSGGRGRERVTYDRGAAAAYADRWALGNNPRYWSSPDNDCADFVSQCLAAGGLRPLWTTPAVEWHANGTDFPTVAWVNCGAQRRALSAARRVPHALHRAEHAHAARARGRPATLSILATPSTASRSGST